MNRVSVGCDPEFDVAGFDFGEMADSAGHDFGLPFGFDGSNAELRPGCSYSVLELVSMIRAVMADTLKRNPLLKETRWVAGATGVRGDALGGHIHIGGLARGKAKIRSLIDGLDDIIYDTYDRTFVPFKQRDDRHHHGYGHRSDFYYSSLVNYAYEHKDGGDGWDKDFGAMLPPSIRIEDPGIYDTGWDEDLPPGYQGVEKVEYRAVSGAWLYSPTMAFLYLATAKFYGLLFSNNRPIPRIKEPDLKKAARVLRKAIKKEKKLLGKDKDMRVLRSVLRGIGKGKKPYKQVDRQDFKKKWGLV